MKNLVIIIALTIFLKPIFPVIEYVANYDYITKVLCVNIDKPALECNGKCHLKKELANEANDSKPITPNKRGSVAEIEILFCAIIPSYELQLEYKNAFPQTNTYYSNHYVPADLSLTFHPPAV